MSVSGGFRSVTSGLPHRHLRAAVPDRLRPRARPGGALRALAFSQDRARTRTGSIPRALAALMRWRGPSREPSDDAGSAAVQSGVPAQAAQPPGVITGHHIAASQVNVVMAPADGRHRWPQTYPSRPPHGLFAVLQLNSDSHLMLSDIRRAERQPGSPAAVPILARLSAIDAELAARTARQGDGGSPRGSVICLCSCGFGTDDRAWFDGHLFEHPGHHQRPQR